jgi:1,4-alpha-glucan branching enzyme
LEWGLIYKGERKITIMAKKSHENIKTQAFSFRAPEAVSVQLVGDFTQWQERPISLKKENGGVWQTSIELAPGTHHYRFLVDGEWRDDPDCSLRVPNGFGSQNMARKVN